VNLLDAVMTVRSCTAGLTHNCFLHSQYISLATNSTQFFVQNALYTPRHIAKTGVFKNTATLSNAMRYLRRIDQSAVHSYVRPECRPVARLM